MLNSDKMKLRAENLERNNKDHQVEIEMKKDEIETERMVRDVHLWKRPTSLLIPVRLPLLGKVLPPASSLPSLQRANVPGPLPRPSESNGPHRKQTPVEPIEAGLAVFRWDDDTW